VYRRFPDKSQLIDDLFQQRLEDLVALMNDALADPDAWHGLTTFLARALELQAGDRGLRELITGMPDGLEPIARIRARMMPLAADLVRLARESGRLRSDIEATDLPIVQLIVGALIDATREEHPELWRRYLAIILRGLAADPDAEPALSPASATPAQVDRVMSYVKPARR
jgi:AcrR family transcriptional regulator